MKPSPFAGSHPLAWLDPLGLTHRGWALLRQTALPEDTALAWLEREGRSPEDFIQAWATHARLRLAQDPAFGTQLLSGSAWALAKLRPAWSEALSASLRTEFIVPWAEAFFARFGNERSATLSLRRPNTQSVDVDGQGFRQLLATSSEFLVLESLDLHTDSPLDWSEAPPAPFRLWGELPEITRLARPTQVHLFRCPNLIHIQSLETHRVNLNDAPRLQITPELRRRVLIFA